MLSINELSARIAEYRAELATIKETQKTVKRSDVNANIDLWRREEVLNIACKIDENNKRIALIAAALPVIEKAFQAYDGKKYGPKTKEQIRENIKKSGYFVYLDRRYSTIDINISIGYGAGNDAGLCGKYDAPQILTEDNKINVSALSEYYHYYGAYVEDPIKQAEKILAAKRAAAEKEKELNAALSELNSLLPQNMNSLPASYIKFYDIGR